MFKNKYIEKIQELEAQTRKQAEEISLWISKYEFIKNQRDNCIQANAELKDEMALWKSKYSEEIEKRIKITEEYMARLETLRRSDEGWKKDWLS